MGRQGLNGGGAEGGWYTASTRAEFVKGGAAWGEGEWCAEAMSIQTSQLLRTVFLGKPRIWGLELQQYSTAEFFQEQEHHFLSQERQDGNEEPEAA